MLRYSTVSTLKPWERGAKRQHIAQSRSGEGKGDGCASPKVGEQVWRTDGRNGSNDFTQLQLVENGGLSCGVKTDHQNAHLLVLHEVGEHAKQLRYSHTHFCGCCGGTLGETVRGETGLLEA